MDIDELKGLLARFFASSACPVAVDAAYLFGSRARGDARSTSDVDLGVLLERGAGMVWPLPALEIGRALEDLSPLEFDVVSLRDAPPDLVHRVLRDGQLVHERSRARRIEFEVASRNEFFDIEPILLRYRRSGRAA